MPSLAALPHGVPIPPDAIHGALLSAAVPGYTGVLHLQLSVRPEAAAYVMVGITRRQSRSAQHDVTHEDVPAVGDHVRKKSVQKAMDDIQPRLVLRTVILSVEAHYVDGELRKWTVSE